MADGVYTASDLVNAYKRIDPSKIGDIPRILASLPGGASGSYTLQQLQGIGSPARGTGGITESGLTGLSSRSLTAWNAALSGLGSGTSAAEGAAQDAIGGIGGGNFDSLQAAQIANLQASTAAQQLAIKLAKERAALGKKYGGTIFGEGQTFIDESTPLRKAIIGSTERALGLPVSSGSESPVALFGPTAPERNTLEQQYNLARQGILESTPTRGGQLNASLNAAQIARARAMTDLQANATNKALALGTQIGFEEPKLGLAAQESGANIATGNLGGAASNVTAAGLGLTGVASGYNQAANTLLQSQYLPATLSLQEQGLLQQGDLATMALLAQERMAGNNADAAKKGGTGAGAGAGAGAILSALISKY